ncbi:MAG: hypothetical protein K0U41_00555 [Gammaproteobacteria bacterium]|nr:hypothetical protein [Gammaproteobacteria bacterium]
MKNITQINLTKTSIALALVMALTGYSSMSQAAEIELLDRGVYPYLGFGGGLALLSGVATPSYTADEDLRPLALGAATQAYYSVALGFVWKRGTSPGWQSMFQLSYRPLAFSTKSSGRTHNYKQNMLSLDFLESYGYFSSWVPYIGLSWNFYNLQFEDTGSDEGATSESTSRLGIVGGWDILSNPDSHWRFRTNFRWHPEISLNYAGDKVSFPNFEIEPIQVIYRF